MLGIFLRRIVLQIPAKELAVEDIDTHGSQVALWLRWLLLELDDAAIHGIGIHDAEARCLIPRNLKYANGSISLVGTMYIQHLGVIHGVDMVAGKNQHIVRIHHINEIQILIDGIRCTLVPVSSLIPGIRWQDEHAAGGLIQVPGIACTQIGMQLQRAILCQNAYCIDAGIGAV